MSLFASFLDFVLLTGASPSHRVVYMKTNCATCDAPLDTTEQLSNFENPNLYCTLSRSADHPSVACVACGEKFRDLQALKLHAREPFWDEAQLCQRYHYSFVCAILYMTLVFSCGALGSLIGTLLYAESGWRAAVSVARSLACSNFRLNSSSVSWPTKKAQRLSATPIDLFETPRRQAAALLPAWRMIRTGTDL